MDVENDASLKMSSYRRKQDQKGQNSGNQSVEGAYSGHNKPLVTGKLG